MQSAPTGLRTGGARELTRGEGTCRLVKGDVRKRRAAYRAVRTDSFPAPSVIAGRPEAGKLCRSPFRARLKY